MWEGKRSGTLGVGRRKHHPEINFAGMKGCWSEGMLKGRDAEMPLDQSQMFAHEETKVNSGLLIKADTLTITGDSL